MTLKEKSNLMDAQMIKRTLMRISHEILERNKGPNQIAVVGIRNRGAYLANRIVKMLKEIDGNDEEF